MFVVSPPPVDGNVHPPPQATPPLRFGDFEALPVGKTTSKKSFDNNHHGTVVYARRSTYPRSSSGASGGGGWKRSGLNVYPFTYIRTLLAFFAINPNPSISRCSIELPRRVVEERFGWGDGNRSRSVSASGSPFDGSKADGEEEHGTEKAAYSCPQCTKCAESRVHNLSSKANPASNKSPGADQRLQQAFAIAIT
ncbi:hypothetical protein SERLA73DRAFT_74397 [Serpula lacrymans var. lacrymans S7.3]|uniref:Uncharacterized protein n=1 Tax=Serpula lacrymans var. lacrymans (strain S7.3) TaxID=936435 RepID=F8Q1J0_SERL3|nr:hypothetical protein SERLA73DRAFT_74397 [Serpula lacrymans var. lacrymans S7.3]